MKVEEGPAVVLMGMATSRVMANTQGPEHFHDYMVEEAEHVEAGE